MHRKFSAAALAAVCMSFTAVANVAVAAAPDAGLVTTYLAATDGSEVVLTVCGSLAGCSGCLGSSTLRPFKHACAVLESTPKVKNNVVTRAIYVLDNGSANHLVLNMYTRTDTITGANDDIEISGPRQVTLGIPAGKKSHCAMTANDGFVFAGTDAAPAGVATAAMINKKTLATEWMFYGVLNSITRDSRGYVAVDAGDGISIYKPNGDVDEDGVEPGALVGTQVPWKPN